MESVKIKFLNCQQLPLVIEPLNTFSFTSFLDFLQKNKNELNKKLLRYGGILFRNFPIEGAEAFNTIIETLNLGKSLNYIGGDTPRDQVQGKIYTSTEAPPSFKIPLHNEMSFVQDYPKHIYFYCAQPSETGGETLIGDARRIYQSIDPKVRDIFSTSGLRYISNFYGKSWLMDRINKKRRAHKTWMDAFETKDPSEVEKLCIQNNFGHKWMPKNWLQVIYESNAVMKHPQTQEPVWFNQAHLYDYNPRLLGFMNWMGAKMVYARKHTVMHEIYFNNGTKIPRKNLYHIMDVLDDQTIKFPWQKNDLMVLDNVLAMHGRAPFTGKRKILVSMTK